ncbi:MAG TPA: ferrochelatase [Anaerolineae bacterium]|nr:ferrochelatase [Anaerolineae bacterium]
MKQKDQPTAVLLMAYGSPNSLEEVEAYYTDVRGGRPPSPELLTALQARYARVGGRTPLLEITKAQADALETKLGADYRVYIGMKHWHPYIAETIPQILRAGCQRLIALTLAPHYSRMSVEGYFNRVRDAIQKKDTFLNVTFIPSWGEEPLYIESIAERMSAVLPQFTRPTWDDTLVVFTAHSLPERILMWDDPYPQQLRATAELVAARLGLAQWRQAYQSAGRTYEKWLGPDLLEELSYAQQARISQVLVAPIGFVSDHLEILYDIDIEACARAQELGIELQRTASANATSRFIDALAAIVQRTTE